MCLHGHRIPFLFPLPQARNTPQPQSSTSEIHLKHDQNKLDLLAIAVLALRFTWPRAALLKLLIIQTPPNVLTEKSEGIPKAKGFFSMAGFEDYFEEDLEGFFFMAGFEDLD